MHRSRCAPTCPLVNRATRFVVTGTALAGLGATIAAFALTFEHGWGNPLDHPRAHGAARDRLGLPAHVPAQRGGGRRCSSHEVYSVIAMLLLPPLGRARGVPHRHGLRAADQTPVVDQSGLQPRSDDAVGRRRPHDLPAHRQRLAGRDLGPRGARRRSPPRSRCLRSAKHSSASSSRTSEGIPFWANLRDGLGLRFLQWVSAVSVGMLAALERRDVSLVARCSRPSLSFMVHVVLERALARATRPRTSRPPVAHC